MIIAIGTVKIHTPWVHSLKEKRMVVKSICAKVRNKFNVSIAEIDEQDIHQITVLGFAGIAGDKAQGDSIIDNVINFIESSTEGAIISIERDLL
ncbi:MAG: DUF503 domain-containing protein [Proteocatella sp.]